MLLAGACVAGVACACNSKYNVKNNYGSLDEGNRTTFANNPCSRFPVLVQNITLTIYEMRN